MSVADALHRAAVVTAAKADEALDQLLYRPAVVKAAERLPRWWLCALARLSRHLDERWQVGWWDDEWVTPGPPCDVCGRRASIHIYGGTDHEDDPPTDLLAREPIAVCGWCRLDGPILTREDLRRASEAARSRSVAWRRRDR